MTRVRLVTGVVAILVAVAVAGCTDEGPPVASAGGTPTATPGLNDPLAQELAFVECMREQGIADMPDPVPGDSSGRSSVRYAIDVMGKGSDMAFQAALDICVMLLPEPPPPPPADAEGQLLFAECMRDHGVPQFPDELGTWLEFVVPGDDEAPLPAITEVDGRVVFNLDDPTIAAAFDACQDLVPGDDGDGGQAP